jgi:molecular chaperone HscA
MKRHRSDFLMSLLQLSEPGQTPAPHQSRLAIGIDLGTTHSLVAALRHGMPECLPDEQGRVLFPSALHYHAKGRDLGWKALEYLTTDPANTITSAKRLMGRSKADIAEHQTSYELLDQPGQLMIRTPAGGDKSPVEIAAEILASLRQRAEDSFDDEIFGAVITVPAYFDDAQRQATKDAAKLAGLNVLRLINEPTAAAIAYGLDQQSRGTYAVYDLGGGTFDVSILRLTEGVFEVLATAGDTALGGDDIDRAVADWLSQAAGAQPASAQERAALLGMAKRAKEALSEHPGAQFTLVLGSRAYPVSINREQLAEIARPLIDKTLSTIKRALRDAKLGKDEVDGVVMVGGSTRLLAVQDAVAQHFGKTPLTNLNPDEVVALGASISAHQLAGNQTGQALLLLDVTPLSLGVETMGGLVEQIIPRNTTIPCAMAQDFTTFKDGQTALAIHVLQGERDLVANCRSLARFELRGIPPMAAGAARIRVTYTVDADGLLQVAAQEESTGVEAKIDVKPSYGLNDGDITRMLQDSFRSAKEDAAARALAEAKLAGIQLLQSLQSALAADGHLLSETERYDIDPFIADLQMAVERGTAPGTIEAATVALVQATDDFAGRRMNQSIASALEGKALNTL